MAGEVFNQVFSVEELKTQTTVFPLANKCKKISKEREDGECKPARVASIAEVFFGSQLSRL